MRAFQMGAGEPRVRRVRLVRPVVGACGEVPGGWGQVPRMKQLMKQGTCS